MINVDITNGKKKTHTKHLHRQLGTQINTHTLDVGGSILQFEIHEHTHRENTRRISHNNYGMENISRRTQTYNNIYAHHVIIKQHHSPNPHPQSNNALNIIPSSSALPSHSITRYKQTHTH